MSHEHLGLFDTPANRWERGFALGTVGLLLVAFLFVLPVIHVRLGEFPAFVPTICALIFVGDLIVGSLLYAQATLFRSRALTVLASGYILSTLLLIPYAMTFPGAFAPGGMLGPGLDTTAWLMVLRRYAAAFALILYGVLRRAEAAAPPEAERPAPYVTVGVVTAIVLAAGLTLLATRGQHLLPPIFISRTAPIMVNLILWNIGLAAFQVVGIALLLWRRVTVLDTWLLVSVAAGLIQTLLCLPLMARFTVGWYGLFLLMLVSHMIVLLALIAESNRLYVRLALSTAAQNRERDARMMSMDGVAAAISHEVGQPLAAVSLSASAALSSLTRGEPDSDRAIRSLRDTIDANQKAFAVVKGLQAMFGRKTNGLTEFDLNELVRESAGTLDREMAVQGVSLRLVLDEAMPPILANRVQMQRVIVNLLANAIDAVEATPKRRGRRIAIQTSASDPETLRVEVSDSGCGIAPEAMGRIFEPFFTTKPSGTGLGLSLSRTIVEDHGGRLWASRSAEGGATFHLELRSRPTPGV